MEGHHDLSNINEVDDPHLLDNKIDSIRLSGHAKFQVFVIFLVQKLVALRVGG